MILNYLFWVIVSFRIRRQFCPMTRRNPYFSFALQTASVMVLIGSISSLSIAQMSLGNQMENDSLNLMIQQWHSLPEASVQAIGLAAGAKGVDEVPGALHVIGQEELERYSYTDPLRVLRTVSGVNIQEEDGYGLRPNIGMRGSGTERSARITIMEDGVLMAPAAYSAPAAYYFPSIARMQSIEVLKGSSQIAFGPQTAGGAINLVTAGFDDVSSGGMVRYEASAFGGFLEHARVTQKWNSKHGSWGVMAEGMRLGSDGFKSLPNGGSTGFDKSDRMFKMRWKSKESSRNPQSLQFKWSETEESSNETYAGLSEEDFNADPFQRYSASENDLMKSAQSQAVLTHEWQITNNWSVKTDIYRTNFERNWYKLDRAKDSLGQSISLQSLIDGMSQNLLQADTPEGFLLQMKANNRAYEAKGIQHRGSIQLPRELGQLVYGVRWHEDYADRFQWRDGYQLVDGEMQLTDADAPGTAGNRIDRAQALASFVRGTIRTGNFTWTPGLRMENMEMARTDWGSSDLDRTGSTPSERTNPLTVWLPGLGLNYAISESAHIFAGVHRGFIPPGSNDETTAETSINAELGLRFDGGFWSGQAVAFNNIYQNLLGADLAATGGQGSGDLFNGGSARSQGFELEAACNAFAAHSKWAMPIRLSYTYTNAQFTSAFESDYGPWDAVVEGDYMPYLAPHQFSVQVAMQNEKWSLETNTRYVAAMRTSASQGSINPQEATDESIILDALVRCELRPDLQWHFGMNNVFNSAFIVARRPAGIRAGMPRLLRTGLRFTF